VTPRRIVDLKLLLKGLAVSQACSLCGTATDGAGHHRRVRLCEPCSRALSSFSKFLESVESPAALVARDLTVVFSNSRLCGIAEKCGEEAVGLKLGQALGCMHAEETRVCGQSDACLHCWLRRSVDLARISGERLPNVPFDFTPRSGTRRSFKVSVEKAGDAVVLEIRPQPARDSSANSLA
jgi:hypothetical protein